MPKHELTGTAYDFMRVNIRHSAPKCGQQGLYPLRDLVAIDSVICSYCGGVIDISSDNQRRAIAKLAEEYKQIKALRQR